MLHGLRLALVLAHVIGALCPSSGTQVPTPMGGSLSEITGFDRLIMNESVHKELKLSDEQVQGAKEAVHRIRQQHRADFDKAINSDAGADRRERVAQILQRVSADTLTQLKVLLKPQQLQRLKQIELQGRGLRAFDDAEIVETLRLTPDQKSKLHSIAEQAGRVMSQSLQTGDRAGNSSQALQKLFAARRKMMDEALSLLTPEQRKAWDERTGPPFEFKIERGGRRDPRAKS